MDNDMMNRVKRIQLDRIGASCFFDAISCSLEYMDRLYWALEYTQYKFLYNYKSFVTFKNDNDLVKLLSKTDKYYFYKDPKSLYRSAISKYDVNLLQKKLRKIMQFDDFKSEEFYEIIGSLDVEKLPVILLVDTLSYKEFYKEHNFTVPRSDCNHKINILKISDDKKKAFIFDRGFDCFGEWIDISELYKGATSLFLENNGLFSIIYFKSKYPPKLCDNEIRELYVENLENFFKDEIVIDDIKYLNNGKALEQFRLDLKDIVYELEGKYGDLAAALMGEALVQQVDGAMGLVGLYGDVNRYIMSKSLKKILPNFRHYWESWKNLESRLQYVTYNNKKLSNYIDNLEKIVDSIASDNAYIMKYAEIILCSLKNC